MREQLDSGWREAIDQIFDERFAEVEGRLYDSFETAVSARATAVAEEKATYVRSSARRDLDRLVESDGTQVEAGGKPRCMAIPCWMPRTRFAGRAAFFLVTPRGLKIEGARGAAMPEGEVPDTDASAPAFGGAIESKDTVISGLASRAVANGYPVCSAMPPTGESISSLLCSGKMLWRSSMLRARRR